MGKTRGHGSRRGAYKGHGRPSKGRGEEDESSSEEEYEVQRSLGGQAATAGMLPPSDSEEEDEGAKGDKGEEGKAKKEAKEAKKKLSGGQDKNAGKMPPSGSEDEDEDDDDDDDEESDEAPLPDYLTQPSAPRKKKGDEEPDPEQIRKDIERLEMIKQRREQDRLKRIKDEGWDRYAPISETNKPPGYVPGDHPSQQE